MRLFVGDDWAENHHDIEVMDETGKVLAKRRLSEGVAGGAGTASNWSRRYHEGSHCAKRTDPTDRTGRG